MLASSRKTQDGENPNVVRIPFDLRTRHCITEAGTGAGKTTTQIVPQLIEDAFSGVCNNYLVDRKSPDIAYMVGGAWAAAGRRVILFDPWTKGLTWGMEPLWGATPDQIRAMVEAHVQISYDPADTTRFYREQEKAILEALFTCAQEWGKRDRRLATLPAIAELVALGFETVKVAIQNARPDINRKLVDQWKLSDGDLAKLFRSIYSRLGIYLIPEVAAAFSRRDFTIDDVVVPYAKGNDGGLRTIMIVGAHQAKGAAAELIASFVTQMVMHAVYERSIEMKLAGARWPDCVPLAMTLDEIGTYQIGRIEDFQAVARDGGVALSLALQERTQFDQKNGKDASKRILRNCAHRIVMRGMEILPARELSEEIGQKWVLQEGRMSSRGASTIGHTANAGKNHRWMEHPVLTPEQIVRLPKDRALVFGPDIDPFVVKLIPFYQSPRLLGHVERSKEWAMQKRERNLRCDAEGVKRPGLEVPALATPVLDWTPFVGQEMLLTGTTRAGRSKGGGEQAGPRPAADPNDQPLSKDQEKRIRAKCRDLELHVDVVTKNRVGKLLKDSRAMGPNDKQEITRGEAAHILSYLEEREREVTAETMAVN